MPTLDVLPPVRESITVPTGQQRAFEVFTEELGMWWPREYSIGAVEMANFVLERWPGGRWYEVGVDGTECETGLITAYEPPDRLILAWHLNGSWRYDPDPAHASEVEIRFVAQGPDRTRVDVEHRHFERHGDGAHAVREAVASRGGWGRCLSEYAAYLPA